MEIQRVARRSALVACFFAAMMSSANAKTKAAWSERGPEESQSYHDLLECENGGPDCGMWMCNAAVANPKIKGLPDCAAINCATTPCAKNVQFDVDNQIVLYRRYRSELRTWHRSNSVVAGTTGAGLAIASTVAPPVVLTLLAIGATAPIMVDDLTQTNNRSRLYAGAMGALQGLSRRYETLRSAGDVVIVDANPWVAPPTGATAASVTSLDATCMSLAGKQAAIKALASGVAATSLNTEFQALTTQCVATQAVSHSLKRLSAELIEQYRPLKPDPQWPIPVHNPPPAEQQFGLSELDRAFAFDTVNLIDQVEALARDLDVPPNTAFGTAVAAPIQAVANLLKDGSGANPYNNLTLVSQAVPVAVTTLNVTLVTTTALPTNLAMSDDAASAFKDTKSFPTDPDKTSASAIHDVFTQTIADLNAADAALNPILDKVAIFNAANQPPSGPTDNVPSNVVIQLAPPTFTPWNPTSYAPWTQPTKPANGSQGGAAASTTGAGAQASAQ